MLSLYLGEDQDIIIAIKIVLGVLELHKHIKAPELRLTCKVLYQSMNLLEDRPGSNNPNTFKYDKKDTDTREKGMANFVVIHKSKHKELHKL